jgi:hypothetical protein
VLLEFGSDVDDSQAPACRLSETLDVATIGRDDSGASANGGLCDRRVDRPDALSGATSQRARALRVRELERLDLASLEEARK